MKKMMGIVCLVCILLGLMMVSVLAEISLDNDNQISDEKFRLWLKNSTYNTDKDDTLSQAEIEKITTLFIGSDCKATTIDGLELFTSMTSLELYFINLTTLDLDGCTSLTQLTITKSNGKGLSALDVSGLTELTKLSVYYGTFSTLDLSNNIKLTDLTCREIDGLTSLTLPSSGSLTKIHCQDCELITLDISAQKDLTFLQCNNNQINRLDLQNCETLSVLNCDNNALTELDVTMCTELKMLSCGDNQLSTLQLEGLVSDGSMGYAMSVNTTDYGTNSAKPQKPTDSIDCTWNGSAYQIDFGAVLGAEHVPYVQEVKDQDGTEVPYDKTTGLAVFSTKPTSITYWYNTRAVNKSDNNNAVYMLVALNISDTNTYLLTVDRGTFGAEQRNSGTFKKDEQVTLTADAPSNGETFKEWVIISGKGTLTDAQSTTTTFTMLDDAARVEATYEKEPQNTPVPVVTPTPTPSAVPVVTPTPTPSAVPVVTPTPTLPAVQVAGGNGDGTVTADGISSIVGTVECDFNRFVKLLHGDKELKRNVEYTATAGSIVIQLQPNYIKTLSPGKYTYTIVMTDGKSDFTITVVAPPAVDYPQTGEQSHLWLSIALVCVGFVGVLMGCRKKRT